jgi:hypothetical protein
MYTEKQRPTSGSSSYDMAALLVYGRLLDLRVARSCQKRHLK